MSLDWQELGSKAASKEFYELRDEYLSNKFKFQDYGFTFLILGGLSFFIFRRDKPLYSPSSKTGISMLGFGAALLTTACNVGDLFLEFYRGAYPWWADSMGIPLMGVPFLALIYLGWSALNLLGMNGNFIPGAVISFRKVKGSNYFYLFLIVVSILLTGICVAEAYFWMVLPGILWVYFYASLWAGRFTANKKSHPTHAVRLL